jgi:hypothetical protein
MHGVLPLVVGALLATGCGAARNLDEAIGAVLAPPGSTESQVSGEITNVDTRNQIIDLRTSDGRSGQVRYDNNTRVVYQQQEYNVTALERGDVVSMRLQNTNNNELYTNEILVTQSVQDRTGVPSTGTSSGLQRLEGTVGVIDNTRGTFELRTGNYTYMVQLSYNATSSVRDRFNRMRAGDFVRVEGRWVNNSTIQIERFY